MLSLLTLFACSSPSTPNATHDTTPPVADTDDTGADDTAAAPDVTCPTQSGIVLGRAWTYIGDANADDAGATADVVRTVEAIDASGAVTLGEELTETFAGSEMVLTSTGTYDWRCAGGALVMDGFAFTLTQTIGRNENTFSYGYAFDPALVLVPAGATVGTSWQDQSVATYWYEGSAASSATYDYEITSAITGTETVQGTWESLVVETESALYEDDTDVSDQSYSFAWADGVGETGDGDAMLVLSSVSDQ